MKNKPPSPKKEDIIIPTIQDLNTSLEDARFFYEILKPMISGSEERQDVVLIRRYFRAYLHCWKTILHFVREIKSLKKDDDWKAWIEKWQKEKLLPEEVNNYKILRGLRDYDTHKGMIIVQKRLANNLWPLVMFQPYGEPERELLPYCKMGLDVAEKLIQELSKPPSAEST